LFRCTCQSHVLSGSGAVVVAAAGLLEPAGMLTATVTPCAAGVVARNVTDEVETSSRLLSAASHPGPRLQRNGVVTPILPVFA
jgi:hypothetical protein